MATRERPRSCVVTGVGPRVGPKGEHRVGMDVVTPPRLQELVGRRVSESELDELGVRMEGDDLVLTYGGQDWVLQVEPEGR